MRHGGIDSRAASLAGGVEAETRCWLDERQRTQDRFVDFQSQYMFDPLSTVVTMTHDGATHFASEVCSPEDFAQTRPASK
ncbi:hypothetical protein [Paraburkholderia sp. SG-MS1]|uniref:hypothetical protein n=1 Tax=Paraburkholderia sp. SG-MS1 TaxID=2023741 RepID=UPI001EEAAF80|nr:hypothetical protein [Paraburkholderia sp. SG-MS1]